MKQALEALEEIGDQWGFTSKRTVPNREKAIAALRLAIEQAERQEPTVLVGSNVKRPDEPAKGTLSGQAEYERGFIDGMQKQMQSSVDKAVNRIATPQQIEKLEAQLGEAVWNYGEAMRELERGQDAVAQEREACARVLDEMADQMATDMEPSTAIAWVRNRAAFIRARGNAIDKLELVGEKPAAYICEFYADPGYPFLSFEPIESGTNIPLYKWKEKKA
jgi:hypothetical protein